jgi:hypothetical protein
MPKDDEKKADEHAEEPVPVVGDEAEGFKKHGAAVKGVQPLTEDDIPKNGR